MFNIISYAREDVVIYKRAEEKILNLISSFSSNPETHALNKLLILQRAVDRLTATIGFMEEAIDRKIEGGNIDTILLFDSVEEKFLNTIGEVFKVEHRTGLFPEEVREFMGARDDKEDLVK